MCLAVAGFVLQVVLVLLEEDCPTWQEELDTSIPTLPVRPPTVQCDDRIVEELSTDVIPAVDILFITDQSE